MAKSIQFRGSDQVEEAFKNSGAASFSIWQDKQFLFKGCGDAELSAFLELLEQSATNAIYTVKIYEDITNKKEIKSNTPDDGSFNFRLDGDGMEITKEQYTRVGNYNELASRINGIDEKFNLILDKFEEEKESKPGGGLGLIGDILSSPTLQPIISNILTSLIGGNGQNAPRPQIAQASHLGNVPAPGSIEQSIAILKAADPKLQEHLQKLASIATNDKATFAMITAAIDNVQTQ